jgi:CRP-like cAMP-binding protein
LIFRLLNVNEYDFDHMTSLNLNTLPVTLQDLFPIELRSLCIDLPCTKGDWIFRQKKKPVHMFYVASGEVVLQRLGVQGESFVLQRARQGFVAEASLQSSSYHCDALVTVSGNLIAIPIEPIKQSMMADPAFALRWMMMLNREMKRLRGQCERLSIKGVKGRLLHLIVTEGNGGRLPLGAGLKSLASELGITHEALYRTVAELERKGILRREDGQICVL